jgi:hypothetical protein
MNVSEYFQAGCKPIANKMATRNEKNLNIAINLSVFLRGSRCESSSDVNCSNLVPSAHVNRAGYFVEF